MYILIYFELFALFIIIVVVVHIFIFKINIIPDMCVIYCILHMHGRAASYIILDIFLMKVIY